MKAYILEYNGIVHNELWGGQKVHKWTLSIKHTNISFDYFQGLGHEKPAGICEILGAIAQDWRALVDCPTLDAFALEFGYDDMTQARKVYNAIKSNAKKAAKLWTLAELEKFIEE